MSRKLIKSSIQSLGLLSVAQKMISLSRNMTHLTSEYLYRMPNPFFSTKFSVDQKKLHTHLELFERDGIVVLEEYFKGEKLQSLKDCFASMVNSVEAGGPPVEKLTPYGGKLHPRTPYFEEAHDKKSAITYTNNPFKHGKEFLEVALDEHILSLVGSYIGKKFMLQQSTAARYYPFDKNNFGSWQWHHDSWGRKINVMVLFSDVTSADQYMSFMKGSHRLFHSYERTTINDRFTEDEVAQIKGLEKIDCIGKAGTVFIFDANGIHRGNRSLGAIRDTIINQYTAGRYLWSFDIPNEHLSDLNLEQRKFLNNNPNINYIT